MTSRAIDIAGFRQTIYDYYEKHGRHTLPWRTSHVTPYHILVSEIMLQQTGVERVIPKFLEFCAAFPTVSVLAAAAQSVVVSHWIGLGYNRRAVYLQKAAQQIVADFDGWIPQDRMVLMTLPGIGPYTSASIAAFAYDRPEIVIDTNIRTIFIHHFFPARTDVGDTELIPYIQATLDISAPRRWYSALMDYGVFLKSSIGNETKRSKTYAVQSAFMGSRRQIRGAILKLLRTQAYPVTDLIAAVERAIPRNSHSVPDVINQMIVEKLITREKDVLKLA